MSNTDINSNKSIALLATGDEIINGDILNTNAQKISQVLFDKQIPIGQHMVASDSEQEIINSIEYLLKDHQVIITTGGLGPTSDDRTRFAIAKAFNLDLEFDQTSWEAIEARFKKYGLDYIPESNKQQSLFPAGATVFPNPNGTAAGCLVENKKTQQVIIMLPGPPNECLPMFINHALPELLSRNLSKQKYFKHWMLFGVGEGQIAEQLENILAPYTSCQPGYRVTFPYLEFKLFSDNPIEFEQAVAAIEAHILEFTINNKNQKASELLLEKLTHFPDEIYINDLCTGGFLERLIRKPEHNHKLKFQSSNLPNTPNTPWELTIEGLEHYWAGNFDKSKTQIKLVLNKTNQDPVLLTHEITVHNNDRPCHVAAEKACEFLLKQIL